MQDPLYREIILDHWQNPQNYGVVEDAGFDVSGDNPLCGDEVRLTGKIESGVLREIKFTSEGCAISKASASLFTERVKGLSMAEIKKITEQDVTAELVVQLTPVRQKCALLVYGTLNKVILEV